MAKKPFFSIIIPALNEARYLPKLLDDLVSQTYQDFEVIVVDGGSKDKTVALAESYAPKLPKLTILNSPRAHVCTQRNLGASHADAEILIFSDADNRLPPYFLQGVKYRWESAESDLLSFWQKPDINNSKNTSISLAINVWLDLQLNIKPTYLLESMIVISKNAFQNVDGFDENVDYAEGKNFIKKIVSLNYKVVMNKDPQYTISFRRFRKYGTLNLISRVAKLELSEFLGVETKQKLIQKNYPMLGGAYQNKTRKSKNKFIKNIQKLIKDF